MPLSEQLQNSFHKDTPQSTDVEVLQKQVLSLCSDLTSISDKLLKAKTQLPLKKRQFVESSALHEVVSECCKEQFESNLLL